MKRLAICAVLVGACTGVPTGGAVEDPIIGGTRSTGTESTVLIVSWPDANGPLDSCTGVAISSTVVLTAAHCVDANHTGYTFGVFTGDDASAYGGQIALIEGHVLPVASVHAHPDYVTNSSAPFHADIGVVVMADPLPVPVSPIRRAAADSSLTGVTATIVGYGQTTYGTIQYARYTADTTTGAVTDDTIAVGDAGKHACLGDSGGPAFVDDTVIGVDSYGPDGCTGPANYRLTGAFLPFIDTYVPPPVGADTSPIQGDAPVHDPEPDPGAGGGCCQTGQTGSAVGGIAFALLAVPLRRRRR